MNSINKKKRGFTLIELISVVAIILILALIALPSLSGYREKADRSKAVASAKILLNAAETFNANNAGDVGYEKDSNGNITYVSATGTIGDNYTALHVLDPEHSYVDSYIKDGQQEKLRELITRYKSKNDTSKAVTSEADNSIEITDSNQITIKDLRDFVANEGKQVNGCKVYFEDGKIVKK